MDADNYPLVYAWAESVGLPSLPGRKGDRCRVVVRALAGRNGRWVEFEDGFGAVVSGNALRNAD
jgi:hypothetical protein